MSLSTSPRARPGLRLRGFLPLSEDGSTFSTRGQNLPGLIQTFGTPPIPRRSSTFRFLEGYEDLEAARRLAEEPNEFEEHEGAGDRKMSSAAMILMTPEMRSQRLIGNSNPRYKWCAVLESMRKRKY
jgi:hypothetical protein